MPETDTSSQTSQAEELNVESTDAQVTESVKEETIATMPQQKRRLAKPSHKATFLGLSVVIGILVVNAVGLYFLMRSQQVGAEEDNHQNVAISTDVLAKLGTSRNPIGNGDAELTVGPNTLFNGSVTLARDVTVAGEFTLNSALNASQARFGNLQAGDTQLEQVNINGDATASALNLRQDLQVAGASRLQGPVTVGQQFTVNNNANVVGNLAVGGTLATRLFQANELTVVNNLTIGGHVIVRGNSPGVQRGGGVGGSGTVSISGTDTSGTVAVNVGVGASGGVLASVSFNRAYDQTPHVVVTPIGRAVPGLYVNRTSTGFTISSSSALSAGGYAFDYIVMQ